MYALQQSYKRKKELFLKLYFYEFFEFDSKIKEYRQKLWSVWFQTNKQ